MNSEQPAADRQATTTERTPEEIREDIRSTRAELGETAAALAEHADVKKQAKHKVEEVKAKAKAKMGDAKAQVGAKKDEVGSRAQAPASANDTAERVQRFARENPAPLAIAGAFLIGILIGRRVAR